MNRDEYKLAMSNAGIKNSNHYDETKTTLSISVPKSLRDVIRNSNKRPSDIIREALDFILEMDAPKPTTQFFSNRSLKVEPKTGLSHKDYVFISATIDVNKFKRLHDICKERFISRSCLMRIVIKRIILK